MNRSIAVAPNYRKMKDEVAGANHEGAKVATSHGIGSVQSCWRFGHTMHEAEGLVNNEPRPAIVAHGAQPLDGGRGSEQTRYSNGGGGNALRALGDPGPSRRHECA